MSNPFWEEQIRRQYNDSFRQTRGMGAEEHQAFFYGQFNNAQGMGGTYSTQSGRREGKSAAVKHGHDLAATVYKKRLQQRSARLRR